MFKMKQIIFALCAVMMVNAVFAAASDPSGLTLVDLTSPEGNVTSSRAFDGANDTSPSSAFNDTEGNRFLISGIGGDSGPVDLVYSFDTPVNITSYSIKNYHEMKMDLRAPKSWKFYGSNDEGATWVLLDDSQTDEIKWTANEFRFYYFGDKGAFTRYKIEFTANNGDEYLQFARLEFYDVKLEDAVPIEFGEAQSSSDYTSWSVVQRYNLREGAEILESSDVVILIGDSPETLAESNIVPTIDENGISFGMTDCPNGKTYYWQVKCNVNYMGASKEWSSEGGGIKTKILATFIPGKTNFLNPESWDIEIEEVPDKYTDIHIDGDSLVPSVVSCSMPTATTYEYGALEVDEYDTLTMTKSVTGNAESKFLSLLNNGTINIKAHGNGNAQSTGLSFCEEVVNNGMINLNGSSARNRTTAKLNFESNFVNNGKIAIVQIAGDRNNVNFNIKGGVKGENNGEIVVSLEGTRNDGSNYARMLIAIPVVNVAHYTLGGNGVIELLENDRSNNLSGMPVLSGSSAQMIVTNGINHTIMGSGNVDKFSLVNEGLVVATGDNLRLSVQHDYRDRNGQTMINTVNGRMVAAGAAGLYLGAATDKNSQFFNYGLLEARHGSFIEFRKGATESNSKSTINTSVAAKWGGRWAGSGEFRMFRPLTLTQESVIAPGDLATAVDGAGNVIYGTGESTCGTLTFTNSLTMNSGTISEFQFNSANSFDSLHVGGTLKVDGTLKVVGRPHGGTFRMITSDHPIVSDNEKFFSAFDMSQADGVRSPRLTSGSEEYDFEVVSTATDPESGEEITVTETVKRTRYYIDASFPGTFSIVIR